LERVCIVCSSKVGFVAGGAEALVGTGLLSVTGDSKLMVPSDPMDVSPCAVSPAPTLCTTVARELGVQVERLGMLPFGGGGAAVGGAVIYPRGVMYEGQEGNIPIGEWLGRMECRWGLFGKGKGVEVVEGEGLYLWEWRLGLGVELEVVWGLWE